MNPKQLARRDELAREHQLGQLELQCTVILPFKQFIILLGIGVVGIFMGFLVSTTRHPAGPEYVIACFILAVAYVAFWSYYYRVTNRTASLYTRGLVYLGGFGFNVSERVANWGDIREAIIETSNRGNSYLAIYLKDGITVKLQSFTSRDSACIATTVAFINERMRPDDQSASTY